VVDSSPGYFLAHYDDAPLIALGIYQVPEELFLLVNQPERPLFVAVVRVRARRGPTLTAVGIGQREGDDAPITSTDLRHANLGDAVRKALLLATAAPPGSFLGDEVVAIADAGFAPRRGRRLTDERLEEVARTYRDAVARGTPPIESIKAQFAPLPHSTAQRWVKRARERGFLGPAIRGLAGEADQPPTRRRGRKGDDR
jgi:hypothetical protein